MILHDPISGETTPLPAQGQFDYSSKRTSSNDAAQIRLQHRPFGHVLQVVSGHVSVNDTPVRESALLYPGDQLVVGNTRLLFVCDDNLPPQCTDPGLGTDSNRNSTGKQDQEPDSFSDNLPANETTGIRWLSGPDRGHFQSINGNTFIPCGTVQLHNRADRLVLSAPSNASENKPPQALVNGYAVFKSNTSPVTLRHGDVVQAGACRFRAEIPGATGASSFSPSHPHNIQLSEEYREETSSVPASPAAGRWLWVLVGGLVALLALTWWLKSQM